MTLDDAVAELAEPAAELPRAAMRWSLDHWDEAGPRFVAWLGQYVDGSDRSERTVNVLFLALHLMAEKAEHAAFPLLCRLLHDSDAAEMVFSDAITISLSRILISTYNGDLAELEAVIESPEVDEFIRDAALGAMAYLTRSGRVMEAEMRALLLRLLPAMNPQDGEVLPVAWVGAVSSLGYDDLTSHVKTLFQRSIVSGEVMSYSHFETDLAATLADPEGMAGFAREEIGPVEDAIGELESWVTFAANQDASPSWDDEAGFQISQPVVNPLRGVGRNDPCPCGSGKKYKKCCLV